ncbi:MAG: hypothetical protein KDE67_00740 [Sphingobium sp.]|nr:hypothetical protein [Sphingobium sp.]MCP5400040.1 hypothetical protein [Sphingomonas sp.]
MMNRSSLQEDFGALRFQLAYMSYALALTHVHRLPAAPAVFRAPFQRLIEKMLSPDVWTYWRHVSTGNGPMNKSLGELPPQWNPVHDDNIMYSAYIQSMALLYHYLFDDPKYAQPGALTFKIEPLYWGDGGESFEYDEKSLNQRLYWQMVEKGYLGIACEPNCVFQICNQPAILGFRMHDLVYGGSIAEEVTEGYKQAWSEFGITRENGHFNILVMEKEHELLEPPPQGWADFWLGSLINMWNPEIVKSNFPAQIAHWRRDAPEGSMWIEPSVKPEGFGPPLTHAYDFGWAAVCASEVGDADSLDRLLKYADMFMDPVWDNGAYFYPRRDGWFDDQGRLAAMDPHTGNALLGYARLNVPDGLNKLYNNPLTKAHFAQPALVDMSEGIEVREARYHPDTRSLNIAMRPGRCREGFFDLSFANFWGRGSWSLLIDDEVAVEGNDSEVTSSGRAEAHRNGDRLDLRLPAGDHRLEVVWNEA